MTTYQRAPEYVRTKAEYVIGWCIAGGLTLMILGTLFIFGNWPHTKEVTDYSSWDGPSTTLKHTGNAFWLGVGCLMAGIGQLFVLVGLIGQGVKFGMRAA